MNGLQEETDRKLLSLEFLSFDTNIFGIQCGKVFFGKKNFSKSEILHLVNQAHNDGYRHLVAKVSKEWNIAESYLKENGFQFILESVELRKDNLTKSSLPENILSYDGGEDERLIELTREAFSLGTRFHLDDVFSTEKATELHEQWMINLIKSPNIKILTHKSNDVLTGYITINCQETEQEKGRIGLFAVDRKYSGKGIGGSLLKALECLDPLNLKTHWAMTESANQGALKTYFGNGFKPINHWNVFHWNPK